MKLKINKACDLNSISVFPPPIARRSSMMPSGSQASQLRSQPSQQSFSQGISSQHGLFSQISQNSVDETVTAEQRIGSQERENSMKRVSCFPPTNHTREDNQMQISRSSTNIMRKWNGGSVAEHRCQIGEEIEHRLAVIENSLNRFGMVLDSIQNDLMQINKGTKEVLLETEGLRQKLVIQDASLQIMNKRQEDTNAMIEGGLKSLSSQLVMDSYQDKLPQILSMISALPEQIEASLLKLQNELRDNVRTELQAYAIACSLKSLDSKGPTAGTIKPKLTGGYTTPERKPEALVKQVMPPKASARSVIPLKVEMGAWNFVKQGKSTSIGWDSGKANEENAGYAVEEEGDDEINGGLSFLFDMKQRDMTSGLKVLDKDDTERILRKARQRKRKNRNTIIID